MSVLPDVLSHNLAIVFCGMAASPTSAEVGAYYAGPGNRFWPVLHATGLTPHRLWPDEFRTIRHYGLGLTDMEKHQFGRDVDLDRSTIDRAALRAKIERYQPRVLAFVGKRAAQEFLDRRIANYGAQFDYIGPTAIWVLPSTSGAARRFWDQSYWHDLAAFIRLD